MRKTKRPWLLLFLKQKKYIKKHLKNNGIFTMIFQFQMKAVDVRKPARLNTVDV